MHRTEVNGKEYEFDSAYIGGSVIILYSKTKTIIEIFFIKYVESINFKN